MKKLLTTIAFSYSMLVAIGCNNENQSDEDNLFNLVTDEAFLVGQDISYELNIYNATDSTVLMPYEDSDALEWSLDRLDGSDDFECIWVNSIYFPSHCYNIEARGKRIKALPILCGYSYIEGNPERYLPVGKYQLNVKLYLDCDGSVSKIISKSIQFSVINPIDEDEEVRQALFSLMEMDLIDSNKANQYVQLWSGFPASVYRPTIYRQLSTLRFHLTQSATFLTIHEEALLAYHNTQLATLLLSNSYRLRLEEFVAINGIEAATNQVKDSIKLATDSTLASLYPNTKISAYALSEINQSKNN